MEIVETAVCFILGGLLILLAGFIFNLRTKGLFRLALNTLTGGVLLTVLSLTGLLTLALSPFNALLTGAFGLLGLAVIIVITFWL